MRRFVLATAVALACSKSPAPDATSAAGTPGTTTGAATATPSAPASSALAAHLAAIDAAPSNAAVVGTVDVRWLLDGFANGGLLPTTRDPAAFRKTLGEASRKDFGIDILATQSISFWVVPESKAAAAVLHGPFDGALAIAGAENRTVGGRQALVLGSVALALIGGDLVIGTPGAFDVLKAPPGGDGLRAKHKDAVKSVPDGAALLSMVVPAELESSLSVRGIEAGAFSVADTLAVTLAVKGQSAAMDQLSEMFDGFRATVLGEMRHALTQMESETFPGSALLNAFARAGVEDVAAFKWISRPSPDVLVGSTPAINLSKSVALVVPALAAIAVPAFVKYTERARAIRAIGAEAAPSVLPAEIGPGAVAP